MANLKFINHLTGLAKKIQIDVREISSLVDHAGEKGKNNEKIISNFIRQIIPHKYEISTGFLTDSSGNMSKQMDIFIYNKLRFPDILKHEALSIFPIDWTHANFEIKTKIWNTSDIREALNNIRSVKELFIDEHEFQLVEPRGKNDGTSFINYKNTYPLGFVIAFDSGINNILKAIADEMVKIDNKKLHPDLICVLGKGFIKYPDIEHEDEIQIFNFPKNNANYDSFSASIIYFGLLLNNMLESKKVSPFAKNTLFDYLPADFLGFPQQIIYPTSEAKKI